MSYFFHDFELDPQKRLLYKNGVVQPLQAKAFATLQMLAENCGRLVTKTDLLDRVWKDSFVEEGNLTQKIFAIRKALGEDKDEHRFIVTVPGEGYIFVAPTIERTPVITGSMALAADVCDTPDYRARILFIKGRYYWNSGTAEGLKRALSLANEALSVDPAFARAYIGVADSYILLASRHCYLSPREAFPRARMAANRALEVCPDLAEAYCTLGFISQIFDWNWTAAERFFQLAIKLGPGYATAYHWYGDALASRREFPRAIQMLRRAAELDPLSVPINLDLAEIYLYARRHEECERLIKRIIDISPAFARAIFVYGRLYRRAGNIEKALQCFEKASALCDDAGILADLSYTHVLAGNTGRANHVLSRLLILRREHYVSALHLAVIYSELGNKSLAKHWLDKAVIERDHALIWLNVDPKLVRFRRRMNIVPLEAIS